MGIFYTVFDNELSVVATGNYGLVFEFYECVVLSWCINAVARLFNGNPPLLPIGFSATCINFAANVYYMGSDFVGRKVFAYTI